MKPRRRGPDPEIVARVQRAQAGDEQAFSELFEQLQAPVLNYAHQILSDRSSAEDVTQDAFLVAHQRLGMLGPPYDFKSWVYRIAGNLAIDQIRKDRRLVDLEDADVRGEPPTTRRPPEKQVRRGEQQRMIRRSLDRLPPAYRQALVLREIHELSYDELARALECSYDSARQLVHRARLRFREAHGLRLLIAGAAERCTQLGAMLSAFHDGELSAEAETEVREHLAGCPHCREQQEDLRAVGALLAIVPPVLPSPQWTQYVLQQIRKGAPPGGGGGKVNARMVEQPHAHAGDLPDAQGTSVSDDGAAGSGEPSDGRGGGGEGGGGGAGAVPAAAGGRWIALSLFGAAAALGAIGLGYFAWRATQRLSTPPLLEPSIVVAGSPASVGTVTPGPAMTAGVSPASTLPTHTATPTWTPTPTPTEGVTVGTATQNANCRLGPGTAYRNVATLLEAQTATLDGRNADSSWWWIGTPGGSGHCWVWGGSVSIVGDTARLPVIVAPPTETPTASDSQGPLVTLSYAPAVPGRPTDRDKISLTASASDSGGVERLEIWFRAPGQSQASLVRTCAESSSCIFAGGPYPAGSGEAYARAWDAAGNLGESGKVVFTILVYLQ
ncbi:MAG: sigma-70 family RNA polymerase sigma factor [Chloroflexi bacterium]|nr:sigma-70 family RNA polymerase sigma factor [Chloroflexota bacterium]